MADEKKNDSSTSKAGRVRKPAGKGSRRRTPEGVGPAHAEEKPTNPPSKPKAPGRGEEPAGKAGR